MLKKQTVIYFVCLLFLVLFLGGCAGVKAKQKSAKQLYEEGIIDNIIHLLDEVTVNTSRDGTIILNDGWHRFIIARLLDLPKIPVRILVRHSLYSGSTIEA